MANRAYVLDCRRLNEPRLAEIDQICRLKLEARHQGCDLQFRNAGDALLELIALAGLAEVLGVEVERQSEEGEQPRGVEEENHLGDLSV
jgi:hypothetical protein